MNFIAKYIINRELNKKQKELTEEYKNKGLTEELLEKQVTLNSTRNMLNIPDDDEKIYKEFVQ